MEEEDPVIAKLHKQLDEIENRRKSMTGPCKQCRFYDYVGYYSESECTNPILTGAELNLITGEVEFSRVVHCKRARSPRGACGPDGKYFMPNPPPPPPPPPPPSLWQRILGRS